MSKPLVIVESPTKAKTIGQFLGKDFVVESSFGHVRDLPKTGMGIDIEHGFTPEYVTPDKAKKQVAKLKKLAADADRIILATDEDREGEAIAWHLVEALKLQKKNIERIVFHEITKEAIEQALAHPRQIDQHLVDAQQARRVLDRLVGYGLSPLLWKKIAYGLSAGRVQSVALRAIVDRELERMDFVKAHYFGITAQLAPESKKQALFEAKLSHIGEQRIASGKDFDETTGKLAAKNALLLDRDAAAALEARLHDAVWTIATIEETPVVKKPAAPFTTSTLQQESNRKLGLSARETMQLAQKLYEHGHITYMRTDSVHLSGAAIGAARTVVEHLYGADYLSPAPRQYQTKAKGAQEAHEAIRPSLRFTPPQDMHLTGKERDLYELIWMRTMATQMADARQLQIAVRIDARTSAETAVFAASGMKMVFPGFIRAYVEGSDDPDAALLEKERLLPELAAGDAIYRESTEATAHETKPPARFTEAALVQYLERAGVGRPSTYASIIGTIVERGYVTKAGNALTPTFTGMIVTQLMKRYFAELVDAQFTSRMEERLDDIAEGKETYEPYLAEFYLGDNGLDTHIKTREKDIDPAGARSMIFEKFPSLKISVGKYGPYFEYTDPASGEATKASLPEALAPADLSPEKLDELVRTAKMGPQSVGTDAETGKPLYVKTGQYGPYIQVGDTPTDPKEKVKRVSIPAGVDPTSITEDTARIIASLPRTLGMHPQSGEPVKAGVGRFGPYVVHQSDFRSLKKEDSILSITLDRALELLAQPKLGRGRRASTPLRDLGKHPATGEAVGVFHGPYGHYVKHEKTNATIPEGIAPDQITLEQAVELIAAKAGTKKTKRSKKKS